MALRSFTGGGNAGGHLAFPASLYCYSLIKGGRKTIPVVFGMEAAGRLFRIATILVYIWIVGCVIATLITGTAIMPVYCLIALLTLPFAIKAMKGSREYNDLDKLILSLGSNVQFILITQILLGIGYILEKKFPLP